MTIMGENREKNLIRSFKKKKENSYIDLSYKVIETDEEIMPL